MTRTILVSLIAFGCQTEEPDSRRGDVDYRPGDTPAGDTIGGDMVGGVP